MNTKSLYKKLPNIKKFSLCSSPRLNPTGFKVDMLELLFPEVPMPPKYLYEELGEESIKRLVFHHHTNMKNSSSIGFLFTQDEDEFKIILERTADFFLEALGGKKNYTSKNGEPCLRSRHIPFKIDEAAREEWLMSLKRSMKELNFPKEHIKAFWQWVEPMSLRMVNKRTMRIPQRFPFEGIAKEFGISLYEEEADSNS